MFRFLWVQVIVLMMGLGLVSSAFADSDSLVLQSGQQISGQIIERTELQVTVEVQGIPQTYFLGEIASINGVKVDPLQARNQTPAPAPTVKPNILPYRSRPNMARPRGPIVRAQSPSLQQVVKIDALVLSMYEMMGKIANTNRNVVATPDGGIIIVSNDKIVKYDRNLNVVKQIYLKTDPVSSPK